MRSALLVGLSAALMLTGCRSTPPPPQVEPAPEIITFLASASRVEAGAQVTLTWEAKNATSIELRDSGKGIVSGVDPSAMSGQIAVTVNGDTLYILTAKNGRGVRTSSAVIITVDAGAREVMFIGSPKRIRAGEGVVLAWSAPGARSVNLATGAGTPIDTGGQTSAGTVEVRPVTSTEYVLTVDGTPHVVSIEVAPSVDELVATPSPVQPGQTLTLAWKTTGASSVTITAVGQGLIHTETEASRVADGSFDIEVPESIDRSTVLSYEIRAIGADGASSVRPISIYVGGQPRVTSFSVPQQVLIGGTFAATWTTQNAQTVEILAGSSVIYRSAMPSDAASGNTVLDAPDAPTTYTLRAIDSHGTVALSDPMPVEPIGPPTVIDFTATPATITYAGEPVTLTWTATNTRRVRVIPLGKKAPIHEDSGMQVENGSITVYPGDDTEYRLIADNGIGTEAFASTAVSVTHPAAFTVDPPVAPAGGQVTVTGHNVVNASHVSGLPSIELNAPGTAFIDISTTGINVNYPSSFSSTSHPVTLHQTFTTTIFGNPISTNLIEVNINGFLTLGPTDVYTDGPNDIPASGLDPLTIMPFYEDFYSGTGGRVFYQIDQVGSEQRLIVQWDKVEYDPGATTDVVTFQVQIFSGGRIVFAYDTFVNYTGTSPVLGVINTDFAGSLIVPAVPQPGITYTLFGSATLPTPLIVNGGNIVAQVHLTNGGVVEIDQPYPVERLYISEVNVSPASNVSAGQWIELVNWSMQPKDISGMTLDFGNGTSHVIAANTIIPPQTHFLLGQSATAGDGLTVDYVWGSTLSIPAGATIKLTSGTVTETSFSLPQVSLPLGVTWQLGGLSPSLTAVGLTELGCAAAAASSYGTNGQRGTPGAPNTSCPNYWFVGEDAPNFEPIASTGTALSFVNPDDGIATVNLPSPIYLDGVPFSQIVVSTNGYISVNPNFTCDTYCWSTNKAALDPNQAPIGLIAPFWDDNDTTSHGGVYWERRVPGITPNDGYTIVSWENVHHFDEPSDNLNFQVKFFDNGDIEFHYGTMVGEDGSRATTWIEHPDGRSAFIFNVESATNPGTPSNSAFSLRAR